MTQAGLPPSHEKKQLPVGIRYLFNFVLVIIVLVIKVIVMDVKLIKENSATCYKYRSVQIAGLIRPYWQIAGSDHFQNCL